MAPPKGIASRPALSPVERDRQTQHTSSASPRDRQMVSSLRDVDTFVIYGDPQHDNESHVMTVYEADMVSHYAPGQRSAAMALGVGLTTETLIRELAPPSRSDRPRLIFMGDMVDTNSVQEFQSGLRVVDRVHKVDPANRLLSFTTSNHDHFFMGLTNDGHDAFGLAGLVLNLKGSLRNHVRNIHGYEVGGAQNTLFKDRFLRNVYRRMFQQKISDKDVKTVLHRVGEKDYELANGHEAEWYSSHEVYQDFWRPASDGRWNALVLYGTKRSEFPEERWLYLSAAKLKDIRTKTGVHPIYYISLDTMDFLEASSTTSGALLGHISREQVHMVRAFIAERKRENPRSLFLLGGHYPVESLAELTESGLNKVLSFDSVIGYLAAHTHQREYKLLTDPQWAVKYGITQQQPLAQIVNPSVMDYPNELMLLDIGTSGNNPNEIILQFQFKGLDENDIPGILDADGKPDTVCREVQAVRSKLIDFYESLKRIRDLRIRGIANPHSELIPNLNRLLDVDEGLIFDPGSISDKIVAQDVLPVMITRVQSYSLLFTKAIKLLLSESGAQATAEKVDRVFTAAVAQANHYYELVRYREDLQHLKEQYRERHEELPSNLIQADQDLTVQLREQVRQMNAHRRILELTIPEVEALCAAQSAQEAANPYHTLLLNTARDSMNDLKVFVQEYQSWLKHYETSREVLSNDSEMINDVDLFSLRSFRDLFRRISELPYGSQAAAAVTIEHHLAAEEYKVYYNGVDALEQTVPDQIRLAINTQTGERTLTPMPGVKLDVPIQRRQWCVKPGEYQDYAMQDRNAAAKLPKEEKTRPVEAHWNLQPNVFMGYGVRFHGGVSLEGGGYWHLWRRWDSWPGANLSVHGETLLAWQGRETFDAAGRQVYGARVSGELNLKIAPTLSVLSIAEVGPQLLLGIGRKGLGDDFPLDEAHYGFGVTARVFEGLGNFQFMHQVATDGTGVNRFMLGVDILTVGRLLDWWDRDL